MNSGAWENGNFYDGVDTERGVYPREFDAARNEMTSRQGEERGDQ